MRMLIKRIELVANLAIIIVAILLGVVLVRSLLLSRHQPNQETVNSSPRPGTKLSLPAVDWKGNGRTLLFALSTRCHFCTESAPFYKQLVEQRGAGVRFVAVFPQPVTEGEKYLKNLGVRSDQVKQEPPESLGISGTPTLILVNDSGMITDSWIGKLSTEKQAEVLSRLK